MLKSLKKILVVALLAFIITAFFFCLPQAEETSLDNSWNLILVNSENTIPEDYDIDLLTLSNGQRVDKRIYPDLQKMFDDMRKDGHRPLVVSGYRSKEQQERILEEKTQEYVGQGCIYPVAKVKALQWVAKPGTSEHQLGLAVDINPDYSVSNGWGFYDWLKDNAHKYGFIKRYPADKSDITGISNEPWHYRYVGCEAAKTIYEEGICLEEYLEFTY